MDKKFSFLQSNFIITKAQTSESKLYESPHDQKTKYKDKVDKKWDFTNEDGVLDDKNRIQSEILQSQTVTIDWSASNDNRNSLFKHFTENASFQMNKRKAITFTGRKRTFKRFYGRFTSKVKNMVKAGIVKTNRYQINQKSKKIKRKKKTTKKNKTKIKFQVDGSGEIAIKKIKKNQKLKRLMPLRLTYLNPIKYCFVMSFIFPQNSSCFGDFKFEKGDLLTGNEYVGKYSKIVSYSRDLNKETYSIQIEPRGEKKVASDECLTQYSYQKDWLLSLGNSLAKECADVLTMIVLNNDAVTYQSLRALYQDKSRKHYIKKLNGETRDYIKSVPYLCKVDKKNLGEASLPYLVKGIYNNKLVKAFNLVTAPSLNDNYGGFSFLSRICSYNWFETFNNLFLDLTGQNKKTKVDIKGVEYFDCNFKDMMFITDADGNVQNLKVCLYLESYMLNNALYDKKYFIYIPC